MRGTDGFIIKKQQIIRAGRQRKATNMSEPSGWGNQKCWHSCAVRNVIATALCGHHQACRAISFGRGWVAVRYVNYVKVRGAPQDGSGWPVRRRLLFPHLSNS